ncbi:MAG TPA: arsenate reductase ArsC, partial [Candidatus Deferrimicrobium sp.]|nr:arsenate reductase ArsC [Candidatus Deferrimicrobium sp.]
YSAGLEPRGIHPLAFNVMNEIGIDLSGQSSKHVDVFAGRTFDYIITVCDHAAAGCPAFPGSGVRLHWPFEDPAAATGTEEEVLKVFRRVRDEIGQQVLKWLNSNQQT